MLINKKYGTVKDTDPDKRLCKKFDFGPEIHHFGSITLPDYSILAQSESESGSK
jgi:hypothetical protein